MEIRKYLLGYDTFERHRMVAKLISNGSSSVLDVGGGEKVLERFAGKPVVVVNLGQGDVRANGLFLPFAYSTFDTVTSLDVLEHVPPDQRCAFLKELLRVCRSQVVICAPYGSPEHMLSEKRVLDQIHREGSSDQMLMEHVENGLPTLETFQSCISGIIIQTWYSGLFLYNNFCFRIDHLFGANRLRMIKILIAMVLNLVGNVMIFPLSLSRFPRSNANRMYVVLSKS
jgi:SAM-dependent methyltransferase